MTYYNVTVQNKKDLRETHIYKYVKFVEFDASRNAVIIYFADGYKAFYSFNEWNITAETNTTLK